MTQNLKTPFFATLLESQNRIPAPENQAWPWTPIGTDKFLDRPLETHKYPSDGDEEGTSI